MSIRAAASSRLAIQSQYFSDSFDQLLDACSVKERFPYSRMSANVLVFELKNRASASRALVFVNKSDIPRITTLLLAVLRIPKFLNPVALQFLLISRINPYAGIVTKLFQGRIAQIYGEQTLPLGRIFRNNDRACELLFDEEHPVGCIVYKLKVTNEFEREGIHDSLEIKTLVVINFQKQSRKGYGSFLEARIAEKAKQLGAKGIHVMVSNWCQDSLNFFKKRQYKIVKTFESKYQRDMLEFLHYKPL